MIVLIAQIILVLSLGGLAFLAARKIPVLAILPEENLPKERKAFRERVKDLSLARPKELFNMEGFKKERVKEDKATRQDEFDQEFDYWTKVKDK